MSVERYYIIQRAGALACQVVLAAASPVFLGALFGAQASGSLTPAVELSQARYGSDPRFAAYLEKTPLFMPRVDKWLAALASGLVGKGWGPEL